jgi:hypothetical protein
MNDLFGSGLEGGSMRSKPCSISGTTQRASFIRLEPMTGISISFDNKHRRRMARGIWSRFARQDRSARPAKLAAPGGPHLTAIEHKVQSADDYSSNRQYCCRDVRIDQLIQVMEQETTLVRLDASPGFKPVLKHSQRTRPRKQFGKNPPDKRNDMQAAKNRPRCAGPTPMTSVLQNIHDLNA